MFSNRRVPILSDIRNAYIDFSKMTFRSLRSSPTSSATGRLVIGYGFNSNGRYAQGGLLRERFIPRLRGRAGRRSSTTAGDNLDPHRIWARIMFNEKPGGHGERSVAVG